jgi:hypothetical protein
MIPGPERAGVFLIVSQILVLGILGVQRALALVARDNGLSPGRATSHEVM